ncbi:cuticle protein 7-like [Episyrphus balteatus]|uniref:cuticle protein 7-like n=1 Tax=Episyrphus balteatus TaxID=286459 RepID=UPI002485739C|nr:cuticle protein 7-like [Episyrphus balteatus]
MAFKFVLIVACIATVSAGTGILLPSQFTIAKTIPVQYQSSLYHHIPRKYDYDSHPQYKYGYNIQDIASGDSKSQVETRNGDKVNGEYSLLDADGFKRIVKYTSDSINGFNAFVTRIPIQGSHNVKALVSLPKLVTSKPTEVPYVSASAQEIDYEPVVEGAYAVSPIVRAVPVAYPLSKSH